jgi:hypothetical protein
MAAGTPGKADRRVRNGIINGSETIPADISFAPHGVYWREWLPAI